MDGQLQSYHKKVQILVDVDDEWARDKLLVDGIKIPPEHEATLDMSQDEAEELTNGNKWIEPGVHRET
eukprot:m.137576 g.137576  ORF g.137576 m.137576 type:complete len:68 (-) comp11952_c0_seq1:1179-1382(-)